MINSAVGGDRAVIAAAVADLIERYGALVVDPCAEPAVFRPRVVAS